MAEACSHFRPLIAQNGFQKLRSWVALQPIQEMRGLDTVGRTVINRRPERTHVQDAIKLRLAADGGEFGLAILKEASVARCRVGAVVAGLPGPLG